MFFYRREIDPFITDPHRKQSITFKIDHEQPIPIGAREIMSVPRQTQAPVVNRVHCPNRKTFLNRIKIAKENYPKERCSRFHLPSKES